jgi:alcohol dehydrogenase (NADP+)
LCDILLPSQFIGILFEAYSPLGSPDRPKDIIQPTDPVPLQDPVVLKIAEKHKCTAAQVLISWAVHRGTVVLPKSVNASRIAENFDSYQVKLDEDDMKQLGATERGFRFIKAKFLLTEGQTVEQFWDNE